MSIQKTMLAAKCLNKSLIAQNQGARILPCFSVLRYFSVKNKITSIKQPSEPEFGIIFDVDGVITRGAAGIPAALRASELLHEYGDKWQVPILFLTNAATVSTETKAAEISKLLQRKIFASEIVTPHSALRLYSSYFDKHVAICGQGPLKSLAEQIGFRRCSTINEISQVFPWLDACKPKRDIYNGNIAKNEFNKVEAIILLGEPERWEHSLQILLDLLIQCGDLNKTPNENLSGNSPSQLPIFVCGGDLVWSSNAPSPRISLGSFLNCLETLYERLTGRNLTYTGFLGKPSPSAYMFALSQLNAIAARDFGATRSLKRIYCIGDNPEVDVYGANLFNLLLRTVSEEILKSFLWEINFLVQDEHPDLFPYSKSRLIPRTEEEDNFKLEEVDWNSPIYRSGSQPQIIRELLKRRPKKEPSCTMEPVLVTSGVYKETDGKPQNFLGLSRLLQNYPDLAPLYEPRFVVSDATEAISAILRIESNRRSVWTSTNASILSP
ncbi:hypothetical protein Aperf_G00000102215 [Anoplocephala perfoliata]